MRIVGYRSIEEKADMIVDNGYLDKRTIRGEISDDRVELINEIHNRITKNNTTQFTPDDVVNVLYDIRKENVR